MIDRSPEPGAGEFLGYSMFANPSIGLGQGCVLDNTSNDGALGSSPDDYQARTILTWHSDVI
ncbi:hypothetical protein P692DRAFT_20840279, partial [Suillus brevipes Sb2]